MDAAPIDGEPIDGASILTINVPEAAGGQTVIGQLSMDQAAAPGFFTAFACADGVPRDSAGNVSKSDLNFSNGNAVSNRMIVPADANGDICIYTLVDAHIIVDVFGVTDDIDTFTSRRTDSRTPLCVPLSDSTCAEDGQTIPGPPVPGGFDKRINVLP